MCVFIHLEFYSFWNFCLSHCELEMEYVENSGVKSHIKELTMFFEVK